MKLKLAVAFFLMASVASAFVAVTDWDRQVLAFERGWRFFRGDVAGAEQAAFDHANWQVVSVPHDWSIGGPFDEQAATRGDGGFLPSGVSWYRKTFSLPGGFKDERRLFVEFDGVMANSEVWINGHSLGKRPNGYVSLRYDLTPHLRAGANVIAVKTDTSAQPASRWYTGAGIYRHVRLIETADVRFERWSTFVTTPIATTANARVEVKTMIVNTSAAERVVRVRLGLFDPAGVKLDELESPVRKLVPGETAEMGENFFVRSPLLWDVQTPRLYRVSVELIEGERKGSGGEMMLGSELVEPGLRRLGVESVAFGIREFRFEAATGFWLNGKNLKIKGVCLHHDGGAFGAAVPLRIWEQRLEQMKALGVNAIRTAHNPVAPEFLDLCDRMGFLVMHEVLDAWHKGKRKADGATYFDEWGLIDVRDTVRRDRNHPSIILYSAGNEIHDTRQPESAKKTLASLIEVYHREDPTRPVTQAIFRPNATGDYKNGFADMLDVIGQNYREREIVDAHKANTARKIVGTENGHQSHVWTALRDNAPYAGQFIWTGIDYLGESRKWPFIAADFGVVMRDGSMRPRSYERMSWWSETPMVHLTRSMSERAPPPVDPGYETAAQIAVLAAQQKEPEMRSDWTPENREPHEETVDVFSNCDEVELFLNGRSLGVKGRVENARPRMWKVTYEPGEIRAVAKNAGKVVATHELRTASAAAKLRLTPDRARVQNHWDDVVRVEVEIVDTAGVRVPSAEPLVEFSISGPGVIAAVDNGDNASHELFQAPRRTAMDGRCTVYVKASAAKGRIVLTAAASGLADASIDLETLP
ncbi:glycoside hydrolase family 2 [Nibricoccus aquaticus]|uniref:Glycoside hydrolase family 2 n=1 Tax=Nibricoccus aquaticus TaxID=2576891 RepID=A0A290Q4N6_9BACT|nr:glycoside hydrolase family 2 TIM barrel-domain containing protein [Nibricoccus aquaticus]ATC63639.1 glycoside hydrolase family 2 [Nibricoccus aquaticus]